VWLEVAQSKQAVTIVVRDTGIGIRRKDIDRIFEPFEQAEGIDARGAGLGLAISKNIVELHGGSLRAESKIGEGSTFKVTLPAPESGANGQPKSKRKRPAAGAGRQR
jgi:signal transduction histidine kinase